MAEQKSSKDWAYATVDSPDASLAGSKVWGEVAADSPAVSLASAKVWAYAIVEQEPPVATQGVFVAICA